MDRVIDIPAEDLPYWMRQARRGWDWGFLLALSFAVLAAWPFIVRPGLPRTNASENYVFMAEDYADALREGRLYPRWSPNVLGGLGAPIPHYYPPAAPYTAALIKVLFTNDTVRAVRITFVLGFVLLAATTYLFVRRRASAAAGLLAVILVLYTPYTGNIAPYVRGDLAEFLALALVPLLLWAVDRLLVDNRPVDIMMVALAISALLLAHPLTAVVAAGLSLLLFILQPRALRQINGLLVLAGLGLGAALAVFYWLPAVLEYDLVQWVQRASPPRVMLGNLFAPLKPVDLSALIPRTQLTLGSAIVLAALLALFGLWRARLNAGFHLLFLGAACLLIALVTGLLPQQVWLLGIISLCLAIGSSGLVALRTRLPQKWRRLALAAMMTMLLILSLPVLQVPLWPATFGSVEPIDQVLYEQQGAGIAVLPPTLPLPLPLPEIPSVNRMLISGYEVGNINKVVFPQPANRTQINLISHETHRDRFQVFSNANTPVSYLTAYFPGWQVTASGQPLIIQPDEQNLIRFNLPPMNGELVVMLGPTPVRQTAWLISSGAFLLLLVATARRISVQEEYLPETTYLSAAEMRLLMLITLAFGVIVTLFTRPASPMSLYERPGYELADAQPLRNPTSAGLEALAYTMSSARLRPGDHVQLTLYWQALRTLPGDYRVRLQLLDSSDGTRWYQSDFRPPGHYPISRWRTYLYVRDFYEIPLPQTMRPGKYDITVEVFDCTITCTGANRLTFFSLSGQNIGQNLTLPIAVEVIE